MQGLEEVMTVCDQKRVERTATMEFTKFHAKLLLKYRDSMSDLGSVTKSFCKQCKINYGCCGPSNCNQVKLELSEFGIQPAKTGHEKGCFNSDDGCTLEPYLRDLCTSYLCSAGQRNKTLNQSFKKIKHGNVGKLYAKLTDQYEIEPTLGIYRVLYDEKIKVARCDDRDNIND